MNPPELLTIHATPPWSARLKIIMIATVAALGGLLFGFDIAVISGTTESLKNIFHLTEWSLGFTVASTLVGTIAGSILVGKPGDLWGRRRVLIVLAVFYFVSAVGAALAHNWLTLIIYRFIGGVAVGGASVMSPMYIAEIAPARTRGRLVGVAQLNITIGILLAYFSNYLISKIPGLGDAAWRWMFSVQALPAAIFFFLLFFIPESPRWLVKQHRKEEARRVLQMVGEENVERDLTEIIESLHEERVSLDEPFFCRKYSLPILLVFMVASFNQLSGVNAVVYYAPTIFQMAGASKVLALLQSVGIGVANFLITILAMAIIDRVGRKFLLLLGAVGTGLCLALISYGLSKYAGAHAGTLVLASLIGFIAFFALSQGAVIWVFISEIFPNRVRSRGQAFGSFTHWSWAAVMTWTFPTIVTYSVSGVFAFFCLMTIVQFFCVWRILPETKGLSLEQIQKTLGIE